MSLPDVIPIRGPAGTRAALETCAGLAGQTVPDYLRATVARALVETARQLVRPVRPTRRTYPQRGGVEAMIADVEEPAGDLVDLVEDGRDG
jgi:hypothetical protein